MDGSAREIDRDTGRREAWIARLDATLPPRTDPLARNGAITATYARWYLADPDAFRWAGMAVTASFTAGRHLHALLADRRLSRTLPARLRASQADLVRGANDGVFEDVAWAHAAYLEDGVGELERALGGRSEHAGLLEGFRLIDASRRARASDAASAERLAWEGNRLVLEHEQRTTVQRFLGRYSRLYGGFVSVVAVADFRLGEPDIVQRHRPAFVPFMLTRRRAALRASDASWPDIRRFDHRWSWIDGDVLPAWREVETARQPALLARYQAMADAASWAR